MADKEFNNVQLFVEYDSSVTTRQELATTKENVAYALSKVKKWYPSLVPTGGSSGQILEWNSSGTAKWVNKSDYKVKQTPSTDSNYHPLLIGYPNSSTRGFTPTDVTDQAYTNTNLFVKPDTGTLYAAGYFRTDITSQTVNLNNLTLSDGNTHIKRYIERTDGGSNNISNMPITGKPFLLEVELIRWASASDYITRQLFTNANNPANQYVRYCTSGTWGAWTTRVFTDTKVTSVGNHYTPAEDASAIISKDASSLTPATWGTTSLVTGVDVKRDAKGHVVDIALDSIQIPANPVPSNNVTGSGTSSYLTKWNGTNTITNGPQLGSDTTTFLRNDGSWATPTNTTYSAGTGLSLSGTTFNHSNSITAQTDSFVFKKIKYDAQGHITAVDNVVASDLPAHTHLYAGSASAGGPATNIATTVTNGVSSGSTYYGVIFAADPNISGGYPARKNNDFKYGHVDGTASSAGYAEIILGNNKDSTTAGNKRGVLTLYSKGTSYHSIETTETSTFVKHTLPATPGTILNSGTTSFTQVLSSGTKIGTIKIDNTSTDIFAPSDTDINVRQNVSTSTDSYPVLLGAYHTASPTTAFSPTQTTDESYLTDKMWLQPSTGRLTTKGDIIFYSPDSNPTPGIYFRRGNYTDSTLDWRIYNNAGLLTFERTVEGETQSWQTKVQFKGDGIYYENTKLEGDTKVTQSASTTTNYRPIVLGYTGTTTPSSLAGTVTNQVYVTTNMYAQPSTGTIYSTYFRGTIYKDGGTWIQDRDNAPVYANKENSGQIKYYPIGFAKSKDGGWSIGSLGSDNNFYVIYTTDANYSTSTNQKVEIKFPTTGGTLALTSDIPTISATTTGSGNAVTSISYSNGVITGTKGNSFLPLSGGTITNSEWQAFKIKRTGTQSAGVHFENNNGYLGAVAMNTVNGPLMRWETDGLTSHIILDDSNYTTYTDDRYLKLSGGTLTGRVTTTKALNDIITGSGTTAQDKGSGVSPRYFPAKWTFNTSQTPTNGDIIVIKIPCAGHDYGVFISINNGTSYHPISVIGTSRLTTHYGNGAYISLIFKSDGTTNSVYPLAGGDSRVNVSGGCWYVLNWYDSGNNYDRNRYNQAIKAWGTKIIAGNIIVADSSAVYHHLKQGTAFDITYPILYLASDVNADSTTTNSYDCIPFTITTTQSITLTAYKTVYIKGTLSGTTFTPVSTTPLTQTVPSTDDGYVYMILGWAYSSTGVYLLDDHRIFAYKNGAFGEITNYAANAGSVAWGDVTGKPSTYTPASGSDYYVKNLTGASRSTATTKSWVSMMNSSQTGSPTLPTSGKWWHVLSLDCWNSAPNNWVSQLALPTQDDSSIYYRKNPSSGTSIESGTWTKVLDVNNFTTHVTPAAIGAADATHTHPWSDITSKPTTISGYGITDAKIANGTITLGSNTITPLTSHQTITTGSANGTISVAGTDVAVKGLGTAAYKAESDFAVSRTLANNANLNSVTTPGFYNCGGSNSVSNKPSGVDAFGLEVIHDASGSWYTQILYANGDNPKSYRRNNNSSTWSAWTEDKLTDTDTKNTAGSTDTSSKIFLIGATSQAANPQTYSQDTAYVGTDGHIYSNSKQVVNLSDTQALTNKTYNGYTLAAACAKAVVTSIDTSASLPTSNAVKTFVEGKGYVTTDTKNTAGSTDTSSKIYLIGATSQAANPQTYSDNEVFTTSGVLTTKKVQVGGGTATMEYDSTAQCIDFLIS